MERGNSDHHFLHLPRRCTWYLQKNLLDMPNDNHYYGSILTCVGAGRSHRNISYTRDACDFGVISGICECTMITQSKQPSLSIIIPTYNEARRLPQSLHIIAAFLRERGWNEQTEVIVVDDGSNDSTLPAVRVMQTHWPQLMVLALPHRGKGAAIKAGVKHATGDFVFFCDADL